MDTIYEKVKAVSKFYKVLEQYNVSGMATTATPAGANPGTLPVTPQAGTMTGGMDPKIIAAQKASQAAQKKAAQAELDALKKAVPLNTQRIKQLQDIISGKLTAAAPLRQ